MKESKSDFSLKRRLLFFFYGLFIILLPWQTRWIFFDQRIQGEVWEYGRLGLYVSMIALLMVAILFALNKNLKPYFSKDKFLYATFAYFFIVSIFSPMPHVSFYYLLLVYLAILFAHIFRHLPRIFSFKMFLVSGLMQSIFALYQFSVQVVVANKWFGLASHLPINLGDSVVEFSGYRLLRAYGAFPHPNILGGFLFITIFVGIYLWLRFYKDRCDENWKEKLKPAKLFYFLFIIASLSLSTFAILASFSRSALLALVVSLFALLAINIFKKNWLSVIVLGKYIIFFVLITMVFNIWAPGAWSSRISADDRLEIKSSEERLDSWKQFYWDDKMDVLFGQGLGMNSFVSHQNNAGKAIYASQPTHNVFLLALAEIGLIGLIFLLGIFARLWKIFKRADNLAKVVFLGLIIIAMFDHYLWTTWSGWLLLAFTLVNLRE